MDLGGGDRKRIGQKPGIAAGPGPNTHQRISGRIVAGFLDNFLLLGSSWFDTEALGLT